MDLDLIDVLIEKFKNSGLSAMRIEEGDFNIRLENNVAANVATTLPVSAALNTPQAPVAQLNSAEPVIENNCIYINSPMVGIFCTLEKLSKPALKVGDKVKLDQIIGAIEAMKMVCEIEADVAGEFVEYCVNEGDQVEYGQPLVKLKKV